MYKYLLLLLLLYLLLLSIIERLEECVRLCE